MCIAKCEDFGGCVRASSVERSGVGWQLALELLCFERSVERDKHTLSFRTRE